jgi:hypothetical protein
LRATAGPPLTGQRQYRSRGSATAMSRAMARLPSVEASSTSRPRCRAALSQHGSAALPPVPLAVPVAMTTLTKGRARRRGRRARAGRSRSRYRCPCSVPMPRGRRSPRPPWGGQGRAEPPRVPGIAGSRRRRAPRLANSSEYAAPASVSPHAIVTSPRRAAQRLAIPQPLAATGDAPRSDAAGRW